MHRNNMLRLFLIIFAVFILSFTAFYNVWDASPRFVSMNSPRNYHFSDRNTVEPYPGFNSRVTFTTYGNGITLNAYFNTTSISANETTIAHVYIMKSTSTGILDSLHEITINGSNGAINRHYNLPAGHYSVETFIDYIYVGANQTTEQHVLFTQPGENGTVVVHFPYPSLLSYVTAGAGIASAGLLAYAVVRRDATYLQGDIADQERRR